MRVRRFVCPAGDNNEMILSEQQSDGSVFYAACKFMPENNQQVPPFHHFYLVKSSYF